MQELDVDYVLVIFGGVIGYSGDDINKFLWMVRIAEGEHPKEIRVSFISPGMILSLSSVLGGKLLHGIWRVLCWCPSVADHAQLSHVQG